MTPQRTSFSTAARVLGSVVALFLLAFAFQGCLNDDNLIGPNCYDGILNNGEELVDCGGSICEPCDLCTNGVWDQFVEGHNEQWVDCGGSCEPCATNFNGIQDPGEIGIDCGCPDCPTCPELCGDGLPNGLEDPGQVDCGGPDCEVCPTCDDGLINGDETGIDCGGPDCEPCTCECDCTNGVADGYETYIDCGGPNCEPCESSISWFSTGFPYTGDDVASCTLGDPTLVITGQSSTGAVVTITLTEPADGWEPSNFAVNSLSLTDMVEYTNSDGDDFDTTNGGSVSVNISYIDPVPGGYIVGTFNGSIADADGVFQSVTGGSFQMAIN